MQMKLVFQPITDNLLRFRLNLKEIIRCSSVYYWNFDKNLLVLKWKHERICVI